MLLVWTDNMNPELIQQLESEGHKCVMAISNSQIHMVVPNQARWVLITERPYLYNQWSSIHDGRWINDKWKARMNQESVLIPMDAWEELKR